MLNKKSDTRTFKLIKSCLYMPKSQFTAKLIICSLYVIAQSGMRKQSTL